MNKIIVPLFFKRQVLNLNFTNINVVFGADSEARSHLVLYVSKLLSAAGKKILVIDSTIRQSIYFNFNYNELESKRAIFDIRPIIREDIEILCNDPYIKFNIMDIEDNNQKMTFAFKPSFKTDVRLDVFEILSNIDTESYDAIIVEADENINYRLYAESDKRFLVQDSNKDVLMRNAHLMVDLVKTKGAKETYFVHVVNGYKSKMNMDYIENNLKIELNKNIDFHYGFEDMNISLDNKIDGRLSLREFSLAHNESIFNIADLIVPIKEQFKNHKKLYK